MAVDERTPVHRSVSLKLVTKVAVSSFGHRCPPRPGDSPSSSRVPSSPTYYCLLSAEAGTTLFRPVFAVDYRRAPSDLFQSA